MQTSLMRMDKIDYTEALQINWAAQINVDNLIFIEGPNCKVLK